MAQESSVRVNLRASEFELSGSEDFVERMTPVLGALLAMPRTTLADGSVTDVGSDLDSADLGDLGSFLVAKKITKQSSHPDIIDVFVYFHTKVKKNSAAKAADLMKMYEDAGFPKPSNIARDLKNLTRTDGKGHLLSVGYGAYKMTIPGENYVLGLGAK